MNNQEGWKVVGKAKKSRKLKNSNQYSDESTGSDTSDTVNSINNKSVIIEASEVNIIKQDAGTTVNLPSTYNLWCHDIYSKDWSLNGYTKLCQISSVADFWKVFNNLDKLGYKNNNLFFMKEDTDPTWEHVNNRDGGICSIKIDLSKSLHAYEELCSHMVCDILSKMSDDINGISYSPKSTWAIIKIWNKNKNNDLTKLLTPYIMQQYQDCCMRYKQNDPEY